MSSVIGLNETTEEKEKRLKETTLKIMKSLSKRQILKIVKEGLEDYGTLGRCYEVCDLGYDKLSDFLSEYLLKNKFKEEV